LLQSGKLDFVQNLMDFDPRILVKDKLGNTPLHYAAERYPDVLDSMLKKAQELGTNHKYTYLHTYLHCSQSSYIFLAISQYM